MATVKIENVSQTRKRLVVPVTADDIAKADAEVLKTITNEARIQGFRPGHAPESMVRARYGKIIADEISRKVISEGYQKALKEAGLDFCSVVNVENGDLTKGRATNVAITVDIYPEFKLPKYKELEITLPKVVVEDSEVESTLNLIRGQRAQFNPVEREATAGDYVRLSYVGTLDGKPVSELLPSRPIYGEQKNTWEEAGNHEYGIKAISEGLLAMKKGDKKTVVETFAKDFETRELASKKVSYALEVFEVREKKLPELDEAFFKSLGVENLEALKTQIRASVEGRARQDQAETKRARISDTLIESIKCPLPESLLASESQSILNEIVEDNQRRGVSEEVIKSKEKELAAAAKDGAEKRVRLRIILRKVAEAEKIELTEDDFKNWIMSEAARRQMAPDKLVKELSADRERLVNLQQALKLSKALKFVVDSAKVTEVDPKEYASKNAKKK
jgi:trigger factor